MSIKTLIVEDMATYRSIIDRALGKIDGVEVIGKASNGKKALEFLRTNELPDLITLDVEMPIMDGLATLKELRKKYADIDVIMLSGLSDQAARLTIECLELGAIDFVVKPQSTSFLKNQEDLIRSLSAIVENVTPRRIRKPRSPVTPPVSLRTKPTPPAKPPVAQPAAKETAKRPIRKPSRGFLKPKLVLIGVSTGGPKALAEVFENLKGPLPFPILIVQHMPPKFTRSLADSLNRKSKIEVVEGQDGDVIAPNKAYIAPGGFHMVLMKDEDFGLILATNNDPPVNSCRPSVDVLFNSAGSFFKPGELTAIVMTGMGRDGADGCEFLGGKGAYIVSQSEATCTIYGMPKAVEDLGIQDEIIDLQDIAGFIDGMAKTAGMFRRPT